MVKPIETKDHLRAVYVEQSAPKRVEQSRVGCILALIFMPLGSSLDFVLYPDLVKELVAIRLFATLLVGFTYPLHLLGFAQRWVKYINLSYPIILALSLCWMINITEGLNGPYYAGLIMLVLAVALLLPLTFKEALFFVLFTVGSYIVFGSLKGLDHVNPSLAFNNLYFLVCTGAIVITSSYFSEKARFREFELAYQLDQRNKQLAEMDRMKSDFYANISHELRTPLTLILAPVEDLLTEKGVDGRVQTQLLYVRENTYRLLKLVNDLLDVLKLEEKKDVLEKQPVEIDGVLGNIISSMEALAARKVIKLSFRTLSGPVHVLGDASALEKILINLINNAIKFTETGGSVSVRLWADRGSALIEITDTGVGIAEADLPNIFDRFHQVDSSATRKHQGTGLGLALVKELTELQNGKVRVESTPGVGTVMTVEFPLLQDTAAQKVVTHKTSEVVPEEDGIETLHRKASFSIAAAQAENFSTVQQNETPNPDEFVGASLLIVEDEPDVRNYLAEALASIYDVDVAFDGEEGLTKIRENKPDLVVLDLMLPKIDGLSVCEKVKQDPACRQTKIMLLTARTDEQSKMTALEHGADDFLTKPFSTIEIKTRLKNLWENSGLQRDLSEKNDSLSIALKELQDTQGQLVQSEKLNAIGRLAAGLLHEVNNPLNFAFGTFQLLEREPKLIEDESIKEMMADIRVGMERIAGIVKDLKAFAYPEKTDMAKVFSLRSVIDSAVRLTSKKTYNTEIEINLENDLALKGSQSHIIQILVNLIENAVDAMTEAGTEKQVISLYVSDDPEHPSRACIHVKDNGPGISAEKIDLIFDPFFTTKDVGAGMGMGLSIATTIINNHGGQLKVESEEGVYTDFRFDLEKDESLSALPTSTTKGDRACEI